MSIELLETAAQALGPLVEEVVFLGGASIQLWITDVAAPATRATNDVDVISAVTSRVGYYQLTERLRERGFSEASDSPRGRRDLCARELARDEASWVGSRARADHG